VGSCSSKPPFSVTLAIDKPVALFFLVSILVHPGMGLSHISKQQLCILLRQGFNMSFLCCYAILIFTTRGREWWRQLIILNPWIRAGLENLLWLQSPLPVGLASRMCVHHHCGFLLYENECHSHRQRQTVSTVFRMV
jgi:hypothetical protein